MKLVSSECSNFTLSSITGITSSSLELIPLSLKEAAYNIEEAFCFDYNQDSPELCDEVEANSSESEEHTTVVVREVNKTKATHDFLIEIDKKAVELKVSLLIDEEEKLLIKAHREVFQAKKSNLSSPVLNRKRERSIDSQDVDRELENYQKSLLIFDDPKMNAVNSQINVNLYLKNKGQLVIR